MNQNILPEDGYQSADSLDGEETEFSCRICQDDIFFEHDKHKIISPCRCTGSMSFIHIDCFQQAQQNSCELCGLRYFAQESPFAYPREYRRHFEEEMYEGEILEEEILEEEDGEAGEEEGESTIWEKLRRFDAIVFHKIPAHLIGLMENLVEGTMVFSEPDKVRIRTYLAFMLPDCDPYLRKLYIFQFYYYIIVPQYTFSMWTFVCLLGVNGCLLSLPHKVSSTLTHVKGRVQSIRDAFLDYLNPLSRLAPYGDEMLFRLI